MTRAVRILDVEVDAVTLEQAVAMIGEAVDAHGGHGATTFQVATVNPEFVMSAQKDPEFSKVLELADLCLADGTGVVWAARRQGCELGGPVPGVDLIPPLAALCARRGFRLFLLGAAPGVAAELAARLRTEHAGLEVAAHSGSPEHSSDEETLRLIHEHRAQVLLVAFGAPKQDLWIARLRDRLGVSVAIGVGCVFDLIAGRSRRAPRWMQQAGLEWAYRAAREPRRLLGRYLTDALWLVPITAGVVRMRLAARQLVEPA